MNTLHKEFINTEFNIDKESKRYTVGEIKKYLTNETKSKILQLEDRIFELEERTFNHLIEIEKEIYKLEKKLTYLTNITNTISKNISMLLGSWKKED